MKILFMRYVYKSFDVWAAIKNTMLKGHESLWWWLGCYKNLLVLKRSLCSLQVLWKLMILDNNWNNIQEWCSEWYYKWYQTYSEQCLERYVQIPVPPKFHFLMNSVKTAEWTERSSVESTGDLTTIFKEWLKLIHSHSYFSDFSLL